MDNNMVGVILLKRVPTFVRTTIATKAKLGIVFINHATTCEMIYITVVNMNPKWKSSVE